MGNVTIFPFQPTAGVNKGRINIQEGFTCYGSRYYWIQASFQSLLSIVAAMNASRARARFRTPSCARLSTLSDSPKGNRRFFLLFIFLRRYALKSLLTLPGLLRHRCRLGTVAKMRACSELADETEGMDEGYQGFQDVTPQTSLELQPGERQYIKDKRTQTLDRKNSVVISFAIASSIAGEWSCADPPEECWMLPSKGLFSAL